MSDTAPALLVDHVSHAYGDRRALDDLSLRVASGEMFALLGPNGSGKSTLFRLISTIMPVQAGRVQVFGFDANADQHAVRRHIGVVFQHPALDKQLTIAENLRCHGHLYGLSGSKLAERVGAMLQRFQLSDRSRERVHSLSGGLRRKVELAKALLPEPQLLLLDEPSTGLDVAARIELWNLIGEMRRASGITVVLTTHLMDEADRCDRLAIIDRGVLLAEGSPGELKSRVGGDVITFSGDRPDELAAMVRDRLGVAVAQVDGALRIDQPQAHLFLPRLLEAVPAGRIESVSIRRPTLDDVFVQITGRRLHAPTTADPG